MIQPHCILYNNPIILKNDNHNRILLYYIIIIIIINIIYFRFKIFEYYSCFRVYKFKISNNFIYNSNFIDYITNANVINKFIINLFYFYLMYIVYFNFNLF